MRSNDLIPILGKATPHQFPDSGRPHRDESKQMGACEDHNNVANGSSTAEFGKDHFNQYADSNPPAKRPSSRNRRMMFQRPECKYMSYCHRATNQNEQEPSVLREIHVEKERQKRPT
jgi:hypothetical protein